MLLKFFHNWSGGFRVNPIFHFFEVLKNFSFLGLSREPFDEVFLDHPIFNNGGVRENLYFSRAKNGKSDYLKFSI